MGVNSNRVEHFDSHENPMKFQTEIPMPPPLEIHQVRLPPHRTTLRKLTQRLSEIFFPDNPLSRFKNQPPFTKFLLGLQYFFPIFQWGPHYNLSLLRSDFISGLTIASLAIPQGISYAKLANLPPIIGLYSSFVPPLIYSLLGSSRHLGVGPVSIASLVMGSMLSETVSYTQDPILYLQLAFTATFVAGLFQASLGILRLGFVIDFLSKATLVGFMAGAAIIVSLQQLKGLLGIVHFTNKMQIIPVLDSVYKQRHEWSWQTILLGFCFLVFLLTTRHISLKKPKLFWVSAAAPLTSVILSTLLVFLLKNKAHNIAIIGYLPKGLNPPSLNMLYFSGSYLALAIKTGIVTGILSLTEGIAVGRTFAALKNYQVDGNKEMMAIGLMNIAGSCSSCYVTTVPLGLGIAVSISVFKILLHVSRPNTSVLGNIPGTQIFHNINQYKEASRVPSFLILAVESPIYFANSTYLQERILRWVREEEECTKANNGSSLKCVILDMTAVTAIDTSGLETLNELRKMLENRSLQLVLVNPVGNVMQKLDTSKILDSFGSKGVYLTVGEAVADISSSEKVQP
ncbi:sulfate anion transporter, conserved site [Sesbania bispinosa]|nr:sulfate anion transporter, conserved site [Sesbania bispinosa]